MIKKITFTNYAGEQLEIEMANPEKSGLAIKKITGLSSADAQVNISSVATSDVGLFNSARLKTRNIVFTFYLCDTQAETIEQVRIKTYKMMPIKKEVNILFETDSRTAYINGYVEDNEADIFNKMETLTLTIVCPNPYFYGIGIETTSFGGVYPDFEFPFENNSVKQNLIRMGHIVYKKLETIHYTGEIDSGVTITMHCVGTVEKVTIYNYFTRESLFIDTDKIRTLTGSVLKMGDTVVISTVEQKKSIYLLRDGVYTNLLNCLDKKTDWFKLSVGDNVFAYTAEYGSSNIQFSIETSIIYEGI